MKTSKSISIPAQKSFAPAVAIFGVDACSNLIFSDLSGARGPLARLKKSRSVCVHERLHSACSTRCPVAWRIRMALTSIARDHLIEWECRESVRGQCLRYLVRYASQFEKDALGLHAIICIVVAPKPTVPVLASMVDGIARRDRRPSAQATNAHEGVRLHRAAARHDSLGQRLSLAKLNLDNILDRMQGRSAQADIERARLRIADSIAEIRGIVRNLQAPDLD